MQLKQKCALCGPDGKVESIDWKASCEAAERALEAALDDAMHKILAMTDEQINALCRLEGHDPADQAKIAKMACEIALLKHPKTNGSEGPLPSDMMPLG